MNDQDPWDRIHDADRDEPSKPFVRLPSTPQSHEPPSFTKGQLAGFLLMAIAIVIGVVYFVTMLLTELLHLPNL